MTRIKVVSVLAVALVLTALGASSAFAWNGVVLSAEQSCDKQVVKVFADDTEGFLHSKDAPSHGTLTVVDSHDNKVPGPIMWTFDQANKAQKQEIAAIPLGALKVGETFTISVTGASEVPAITITIESCKQPAPTCPTKSLEITDAQLSNTTITWTVHNPNTESVDFVWTIAEDQTQQGSGSAAAGGNATVDTTLISGPNTLLVASVVGENTVCQVAEKTFEAPTATATPSGSPAASASAKPTSTSVPSPPVTGQGSGSGGDNTFGIVLLAMVLGTVVIGGTTLALSRKGS